MLTLMVCSRPWVKCLHMSSGLSAYSNFPSIMFHIPNRTLVAVPRSIRTRCQALCCATRPRSQCGTHSAWARQGKRMEARRRWKQHEAAIVNIHGFREQLQISKSYQTNASNWMHCQKHGCCNCTLLPGCPDVKLVPSLQEPSLETNATCQTET